MLQMISGNRHALTKQPSSKQVNQQQQRQQHIAEWVRTVGEMGCVRSALLLEEMQHQTLAITATNALKLLTPQKH